jgi:hypothetical protein
MRRTTALASAHTWRSARTSADTNNAMNAKKFKSSLRLITVILIAFLAAVSIVEILIHLK